MGIVSCDLKIELDRVYQIALSANRQRLVALYNKIIQHLLFLRHIAQSSSLDLPSVSISNRSLNCSSVHYFSKNVYQRHPKCCSRDRAVTKKSEGERSFSLCKEVFLIVENGVYCYYLLLMSSTLYKHTLYTWFTHTLCSRSSALCQTCWSVNSAGQFLVLSTVQYVSSRFPLYQVSTIIGSS